MCCMFLFFLIKKGKMTHYGKQDGYNQYTKGVKEKIKITYNSTSHIVLLLFCISLSIFKAHVCKSVLHM